MRRWVAGWASGWAAAESARWQPRNATPIDRRTAFFPLSWDDIVRLADKTGVMHPSVPLFMCRRFDLAYKQDASQPVPVQLLTL